MKATVLGVGINDVPLPIKGDIIYQTWKDMLRRCYDTKWQIKKPTYTKCSVCKEWLIYSNFRSWMLQQDYISKQLDKDILNPGNTVYSPDNCRFISRQLNMVLSGQESNKTLPTGVSFDSKRNLYRATANDINNDYKFLGRFKTITEAVRIYRQYKASILEQYFLLESCPDIKQGIKKHIAKLLLVWEIPTYKIMEIN